MSRLSAALRDLRAAKQGALGCYVMGGDGGLDWTGEVLLSLAATGADILEIGIPFSDPVADGRTIQASGARALRAGATPSDVLGLLRQVRRSLEVPLVIMTYYNIVYRMGLEKFACRAVETGVDGAIIADLPPKEGAPWGAAAKQAGLDTIFLVAPTSTDEGIAAAGRGSTGFVYCVSLMGVTGAREVLPMGLAELGARVKRLSGQPTLVGFGISRPAQVAEACRVADGVVVGSALIDLLAAADVPRQEALSQASALVASLKAATHEELRAGEGQ